MKSDSLYLMDQKQYNFIVERKRERANKGEIERENKTQSKGKKNIIPFLLASFVFMFLFLFLLFKWSFTSVSHSIGLTLSPVLASSIF